MRDEQSLGTWSPILAPENICGNSGGDCALVGEQLNDPNKEKSIMARIRKFNLGLVHSGLSSTLNRISGSSRIMTFARSYLLNFRNFAIAICFVFLALSAHAQRADIDRSWTTVGSVGTVDENDTRKVFFDRSIVQMGNVGPIVTKRALLSSVVQRAVIRYNVTPVDSFFVPLGCSTTPSPGVTLRLRYLAAGRSARVVAKLIEVDLTTGKETTLDMTFDSNDQARADKYQVGFKRGCGRQPFIFDFKNKGYYIEATLTTDAGIVAVGSAAGIQTITIENSTSGFPN